MAHIYKDRVNQTCPAPTGAAAFVFTTTDAVDGFQQFVDALADGETCIYSAEDTASPKNWEVGIGTWTEATESLARTTILSSSNAGSAESFTGTVTVGLTVDSSTIRNSYLRTKASSSDAAVTGEVGTMHVLDISGFGANRNFTLPAAVAGDRIGVTLSAGDATYALILIGDTGITINSGSAATEWSRLFISSETVIFRATSASNWVVETDGRIPCNLVMELTTDSQHTTAGTTWVLPTSSSTPGAWTINRDVGECGTTSNGRFTCRRAGTYMTMGRGSPDGAITAAKYYAVAVQLNGGGTTYAIVRMTPGATLQVQYTYGGYAALAVGDYIALLYQQEEASRGLNAGSTFNVQEVL